MNQIGRDNPLIFMHVPKTGGMSMFNGFCSEYGSNIADFYNVSARLARSAAHLLLDERICVYCGHFPFGLHKWLTRPSSYMAIVRHPVSRILSLYYYSITLRQFILNIKERRKLAIHEVFARGNAPDYYEDFIPWIEGKQTLELFLDCESAELDNAMVRRFSGIGLERVNCPEKALTKAKKNIAAYFSVVGVQEQYLQTLELVRATFGWPWLKEFTINVTPEKPEQRPAVAGSFKKRIAEQNYLDMELYEWLVEKFNKQCAKPVPPVIVPGGGRTDFINMKLWKAVGRSPVRDALMRSKGQSTS